MRVAVVGTREFANLDAVREFVRNLPAGTEVVSGGARGVDEAAESEARSCGLSVTVFHADWDRYGRKAGPLRNAKIVEYADRVVAFWDGQSRGTESSMNLARRMKRPLQVIRG